jgi:hypothetical protein
MARSSYDRTRAFGQNIYCPASLVLVLCQPFEDLVVLFLTDNNILVIFL